MPNVYAPLTAADILARLRAGAKLVTAHKVCRREGRRPYTRFVCELGGDPVSPVAVRGLIASGRVVEAEGERTAATRTWAAAPEGLGDG